MTMVLTIDISTNLQKILFDYFKGNQIVENLIVKF